MLVLSTTIAQESRHINAEKCKPYEGKTLNYVLAKSYISQLRRLQDFIHVFMHDLHNFIEALYMHVGGFFFA